MVKGLGVILVVMLVACQPAAQGTLPTLMPTAPPEGATPALEAQPTDAASATIRPTDDIEAMAATGEAVIAPIRTELEQFPDFQGVRLLSAIMLNDGVSINIEANVAPADDVEDTMMHVLALIQKHVDPVSQIRVNTYLDDQVRSLWLWEDGTWTVTRIG